jgi:hypothetical protein
MSAAIWSGPTAFTQPAFGAQGKYKFKDWSPESVGKGFTPTLPYPTVGLDTTTTQRNVDLQQQTKDAVPELDSLSKTYLNLAKALAPFEEQRMVRSTELAASLSQKQLEQLYPFLSAAGAESTARNLAASQAYRRFAEQLPSNVQNIMASKQAQMQSAQAGEADLMRATAAQQQAAKDFAGRFAGQYIQVG